VVLLDEETCGLPALPCLIDRVPEFVVLDRAQDAELQLVSGSPAGVPREVADELVQRGLYRVIYRGPEAMVLEFDEEA
jgi:hypothetical protein